MAEAATASRDRYFDTLRAVAIVRVVVFHAFPIVGLELIFPSMGVMFALGGSLMVKSIDRSASRAVRNRLRRLLPALWVMGLILIPIMLRHDWTDRPAWPKLLLWALPIASPPASDLDYAAEGAGVLWYLVTYLWLVLLSPLLLKMYRRWNLPTILLPLFLLVLTNAYPDTFNPTVARVVQDVLAFGSCWILGMAHREGDLKKLPGKVVLGIAAVCVAGALAWAFLHREYLVDVPVAYAFYSIGFVLALLRWSPNMAWLQRVRPLNGFVSMVNNRAVTIYLWHNVAITIAVDLFDPLKLWRIPNQALEDAADFSIALVLIVIAVLALGWVEDLAARRRPRISPFPKKRKPLPAEPAVPQQTQVPVPLG